MKRRDFIKGMGMLGLSAAAGKSFANFLPFGIMPTTFNPASINIAPVALSQLPRYINIFLYGGPSELAGNLTNIVDINANSQNTYRADLLRAVTDPSGGQITANGFWNNAGGAIMEELIASGDMSIYRTMNRIKDDNKGHGACVTQNLLGNLDMDSPGIATNLAWILENNNPFGKTASELLFPFVTFEGESQVFNPGNLEIPLVLKPVALNSNLQNPYSRSPNAGSSVLNKGTAIDLALSELARTANTATPSKLTTAFENQDYFSDKITSLLDPAAITSQIDNYNLVLPLDQQITYQNNNFGNRLKAAVSLSLNNAETVFISLGSGGLGGWDDHSEAQDDYPVRMAQLMSAIQAAMRHINAANTAGVGHAHNIIINVYGDFGRNVNLNNSMGWDHGNNQNLYTFGGRAISGRGLGKIVGRTERIGTPGVNRQYTSPTNDSYQFEPFALASSMYKQFGVTNPELMTGEPPIDENAAGEIVV